MQAVTYERAILLVCMLRIDVELCLQVGHGQLAKAVRQPLDVKTLDVCLPGKKGRTVMLNASFEPAIAFHVWHTFKQCSFPDQQRVSNAFLVGIRGQLPVVRHILSQGRSVTEAVQATEELYIAMLHTDPSTKISKPFQPNDAYKDIPKAPDMLQYIVCQLAEIATNILMQPKDSSPHTEHSREDAAHQLAWTLHVLDSPSGEKNGTLTEVMHIIMLPQVGQLDD